MSDSSFGDNSKSFIMENILYQMRWKSSKRLPLQEHEITSSNRNNYVIIN